MLLASLLGFEDKRAALVEVNASDIGGAVAVMKRNRLLEDVGVLIFIRFRRFGM